MHKIFFLISYLPIRLYGKLANPKSSLLFMFNLQKRLTTLISDRASDYEGGVHPKHRLMNYHLFFTSRLIPEEKVIDIGSGIAYLAYDMALTGAKVVGIEISKKNFDKANSLYKHPNLKFILGDALKDLPHEYFDTAVMSNVLEHLEHRVSFLKEAQATLALRRWLIRVPCFDRDWQVALMKELGLDERLDETHFIEYTNQTFAKEIREAGFSINYLERRWGEIWTEITPIKP